MGWIWAVKCYRGPSVSLVPCLPQEIQSTGEGGKGCVGLRCFPTTFPAWPNEKSSFLNDNTWQIIPTTDGKSPARFSAGRKPSPGVSQHWKYHLQIKKVTLQPNTTQQLIYVMEKLELLIKNKLKNNIVVDVLTVHKYAHSLHSWGGIFSWRGGGKWSKPGL